MVIGLNPAYLLTTLPKSAKVRVVLATSSNDPWRVVLQELPTRYAWHDVLMLRPGIEVPVGWDIRLALTAYRQPGIAVAVPLCNSTPFLALLESKTTARMGLDRIDRLLLDYSPRRDPEIPALFSGCSYLRRDGLRMIEPYLGEMPSMTISDGCQWLAQTFREQGWNVVCCDHVYIVDHASERRRREMAEVEALEDTRLIERAHPLTGLRLAMRDLLGQNAVVSPAKRSSVQMHIAHSWGGGLDYWVRQYCENDKMRTNLVLRSIGTWGAFGQRIALYRSAVMDEPLRYWDLDYPIRATAAAHLQYRMILRAIIAEFGIETILISSLVGHALDALATGLPTVIVVHDYYPFCPAVVIYFSQVCDHCDLPRLARCFAENEQNRFFRNVSAHEWLSLRRRFARLAMARSVRFAVPSPAVARHWQTLVPALRNKRFTVISHGLDFAPPRLPPPLAGERLRVVVLGSLAPQKGRVLLEQVWPLVAGRVDLYLIGCDEDGEIFRGQPGITVIPRFQHAELADLMATVQPEVGLLLSIWPETFSYTLSELWLLGIPVVATNLGSFADRIQDGVNGFLCVPQAQAITDRLLMIATDRACLIPIRDRLAEFHHRPISEMVADYHALTPLPTFSIPGYFNAPVEAPDSPAADHRPRAVHIDVRVPFGQILQELGEYARLKLAATPRLRPWQKGVLMTLLRWGLRGAAMLIRVRAIPDRG